MMERTVMPELWPGWETVRVIGHGSFGAVYEIQRDFFGNIEKAALKVISIPQNDSEINQLLEEGYDNDSITASFREQLGSMVQEYNLMRKLSGNTNVVSCDDLRYIQHNDGIGWDIYIKMELLRSMTSLGTSILNGESAAKLGADMCHALILCEKHSIVHRDIKPANIFVSEDGSFKLGDFGIAKTMEHTSGGTKTGTYDYMAPEVYNNLPYGSQADIYSLGMVMYWMLNERRGPFLPLDTKTLSFGDKEKARARRFSGEELPAPKNGSEELKRIVLKACAYDPAQRYKTAEEMCRDLLTAGKGEYLPDDSATVVEPMAEPAPKPAPKLKRKIVRLIVIAAALIAAVVCFFTVPIKVRKYETDGSRVVTEKYLNGRMKRETVYNPVGNIMKDTMYNRGGYPVGWTEYEYNASGLQTKQTTYNYDGTVSGWIEMEFNQNNQYQKDIQYNPDGTVNNWCEYEWDANGNLTSQIWYNADGVCIHGLRYDEKGNATEFSTASVEHAG